MNPLDVVGNLTLENNQDVPNAGAALQFTGYSTSTTSYPGPEIKSVLALAGTHNYSSLVLSSYYDGYQNELTLYDGSVGIGTSTIPNYKLAVNGSVLATSMTVQLQASWPDYVFDENYHLPALEDVKTYVDENHHLPGVPSAADVEKNGLNLGEINNVLTKKVEELTLYMIEKDEELTQQQETLKNQDERIQKLEEELAKLVNVNEKAN